MIEEIHPGEAGFSAGGPLADETFPLEVPDPEETARGLTQTAATPTPGALQNVTTFFYAWDHLGTIRLVSNQDRSVMERHDYEPFGVELRPILNQTQNTHEFTGHERDQSSGYDYMHFRFYGSNLGRFMKPDDGSDQHPDNPLSWNLYTYVRGNPVNANDPTGHEAPIITQQGVAALSQSPKPSAADLSEVYHQAADMLAEAGQGLQLMALSTPGLAGEALQQIGAALEANGNALTVGDALGTAIGSGNATAEDYLRAGAEDAGKAGTLALTLSAGAVPLVGGSSTTEVVHYTDAAGKAGISESGALRAGTYVTKTPEIPGGAGAAQVESKLEIAAGKGGYSITVNTPSSNLAVPDNGATTSGGAWQRQLKTPVPVDPSRFQHTP
jgi:RHS repeat-associated protein